MLYESMRALGVKCVRGVRLVRTPLFSFPLMDIVYDGILRSIH